MKTSLNATNSIRNCVQKQWRTTKEYILQNSGKNIQSRSRFDLMMWWYLKYVTPLNNEYIRFICRTLLNLNFMLRYLI